MCLDFKELKDDHKFSNAVGLQFYDDNVFEEIKQQELLNKRLATLNALKAVVDDSGQPYFSTEFLIKEYLKMSDDDIAKNRDYLAAYGKALEVAADAGAGAPPATGAAAPAAPAETGGEGGKETASELGGPGQL
jgi:hypothetical protein